MRLIWIVYILASVTYYWISQPPPLRGWEGVLKRCPPGLGGYLTKWPPGLGVSPSGHLGWVSHLGWGSHKGITWIRHLEDLLFELLAALGVTSKNFCHKTLAAEILWYILAFHQTTAVVAQIPTHVTTNPLVKKTRNRDLTNCDWAYIRRRKGQCLQGQGCLTVWEGRESCWSPPRQWPPCCRSLGPWWWPCSWAQLGSWPGTLDLLAPSQTSSSSPASIHRRRGTSGDCTSQRVSINRF